MVETKEEKFDQSPSKTKKPQSPDATVQGKSRDAHEKTIAVLDGSPSMVSPSRWDKEAQNALEKGVDIE